MMVYMFWVIARFHLITIAPETVIESINIHELNQVRLILTVEIFVTNHLIYVHFQPMLVFAK